MNKTMILALGILAELAIGLILYDYCALDASVKKQNEIIEEMGGNVL